MISKLYYILNKKEIYFFFIIIIFTIVALILEVLSITTIFPILNILLEPSKLEENEYFKLLYSITNLNYLISDFKVFIVFVIIAIFVIKFIFFYLLFNLQSRYIYFTEQRIASSLYKKYLKQNYSFFINKNSSTIINNVSNLTVSVVITIKNFIELISNYILIIFLVITILYLSPYVILISLASLTFPSLFLYLFFKRKLIEFGKILVVNRQKIIQNIQQSVGNIKIVKLLEKDNIIISKFNKLTIENANINRNIYILQNFPKILLELLLFFLILFCIYILLNFQYELKNVIYIIGFLAAVSIKMLPAINKILISTQGMQAGLKSVEVLYDDFVIINKNLNNKSNKGLVIDFENIKFHNVSFRYSSNDNHVIENINLEFNKNKIIGIIGETGSGKSTFIDLILGLLLPTKGIVTLNKKSFNLNQISLNNLFGYVPQIPYMLEDSILNNILFYNNEIDQNKLQNCIKISQLDQFIKKLDLGINTLVGENAVKISGGQKQRINIARSLYNDPQLIVLDEATNSINRELEIEIFKSLQNIKKNKCIIVVTHNLDILKYCDEVYKISNRNIEKIEYKINL